MLRIGIRRINLALGLVIVLGFLFRLISLLTSYLSFSDELYNKGTDTIGSMKHGALRNECVACNFYFSSSIVEKVKTPPYEQRPWFMKKGRQRPTPQSCKNRTAPIWPEEDELDDRIVNQLMFVPEDLANTTANGTILKKIYFYYGLDNDWNFLRPGRDIFLEDKCPVDTCLVTFNHNDSIDADAVFFKNRLPRHPGLRRPPNQIWIMYLLENPITSGLPKFMKQVINWTATYRHDSDIVTPYQKFVLYDPKIKTLPLLRNYAEGKTRKVAWFVSNCYAMNTRLEYAHELAQYISVDIYGHCGTHYCPQGMSACNDILKREYKFYLSFENANCIDYITEKFFDNALQNDVIPIVMGAQNIDYWRVAPYHSYIHVDDFYSPKALASYLHVLDNNDELYNEYFAWKGTGEFINTFFMCRLCALLHDANIPRKSYNMRRWWSRRMTCTTLEKSTMQGAA